MTAQDILRMIEGVDPTDTQRLDGIDARVWCYLNGKSFDRVEYLDGVVPILIADKIILSFADWHPYTRSRDALKGIRPEWFYPVVQWHGAEGWRSSYCEKNYRTMFYSKMLPTEELAELHAILQAVEWERNSIGDKA